MADRTFAAVEHPDRDVEVFERIPWESLERTRDLRWWIYVAAAALVMGAIGVTLGRGWAPVEPVPVVAGDSVPATSTLSTSPSTMVSVPPPVPDPTVAAPPSTIWSEADLMAVPEERLEAAAETVATWFLVERFTRDDETGRSFVEWAGALETRWVTTTTARVTMVVRRLAAEGEKAYVRVPDETWAVDLELGDTGWVVSNGPVAIEAAELTVDLRRAQTATWTDPAGLQWDITEDPTSP